MSMYSAVVYDPPSNEFPHLAVIFDDKGDVVVAKPCASVEEGESLLETTISAFSVETKIIE